MTEIIQTKPQHHAAIEQLLDQCFGPGRVARTAERLRERNRQIDAYARLYVDGEAEVGGSISYWPIRIGDTPALLLGPLAVHPDLQGQGVGIALMRESMAQIDMSRFKAILLVGDLPYYQRVGFAVAPEAVRMPGPVDAARLLVYTGEASPEINAEALAGAVRPAPDLC